MSGIASSQLGLFHLHRPEIIADPTMFYARLVTEEPVLFDPVAHTWLVSRHADVQLILAHPAATVRMDHTGALSRFPRAGLQAAFEALDLHVSFVDGAQHQRLRRTVSEPLQVRHVRTGLAHLIEQAVTGAFDDLTGLELIDVVPAIAARVPIDITRQLLGIADDVDTATIRRWSLAWGDVVAAPGHVPTRDRDTVLRSVAELIDHLQQLVSMRERQPGDAMIDALIAAMHDGALSRDELIANVMMLVTAGNETTTNLISAAVMALADDADLWSLVNGTPGRIGDVVEELGRLYAPTQYTARRVLEPVALSTGDVLPAGASVALMLAAANRDPTAFPAPDELRLDRAGVRPVTFGNGPHHCVGASLARQEVVLVLEQLTARYAQLNPLSGRHWRRNANLRGLASLPITLTTAQTGPRR
ncbi:cytochrome P450 [Dactylosporangium maewongense]|uniref:Cytochrome P450 n=1 Tax=Dactylosporangium maewongense TaxID=634393 RepID=A0ABP4NP93_9ACTN